MAKAGIREQPSYIGTPVSRHNKNAGCGCSCSGCALFLGVFLFFWTLFFGINTHQGTFHIDIIPPYIGIDNNR